MNIGSNNTFSNIIKVVSHYDLSVLSMSVMGFQIKVRID